MEKEKKELKEEGEIRKGERQGKRKRKEESRRCRKRKMKIDEKDMKLKNKRWMGNRKTLRNRYGQKVSNQKNQYKKRGRKLMAIIF